MAESNLSSAAAKKLAAIRKSYGDDAFTSTSSVGRGTRVIIPTGSILLDSALGPGGWPDNGCVEVAGKFSAGKTTLAIETAREVQEREDSDRRNVLFIDFEHALDLPYVSQLGVDLTDIRDGGRFMMVQPSCLEEGWDIAHKLVTEPTFNIGLVAMDSVAGMIPRKMTENPEAKDIGLQARLLAPNYAIMAQNCNEWKTLCMLLNQVRTKLTGTGRNMHATEETPGGNALRFWMLVRVWLEKSSVIKGKVIDPVTREEVDGQIGQTTWCKIIKNKIGGPPGRRFKYHMRHGEGIDNIQAIIDVSRGRGFIAGGRGGHYLITMPNQEEIKIRGTEELLRRLQEDGDLQAKLYEACDFDNLWDV